MATGAAVAAVAGDDGANRAVSAGGGPLATGHTAGAADAKAAGIATVAAGSPVSGGVADAADTAISWCSGVAAGAASPAVATRACRAE
ncbi:hypothetical protein B1T51_10080 [Mycobacterium kansasii]|nr:hypothetical protein B1T43_18640 [Mycobacterium kansasii]ARG74764.1 hypothetical protein B1T51_10080 [Mycobacterium kansasii]ARG92333.1 hypothetical protein B1T50_10610 [Mycobacterium kansasii]